MVMSSIIREDFSYCLRLPALMKSLNWASRVYSDASKAEFSDCSLETKEESPASPKSCRYLGSLVFDKYSSYYSSLSSKAMTLVISVVVLPDIFSACFKCS